MADKRTRGRPKGSLNKATADVKALAQNYTDAAMSALVEIMNSPEHPAAARVSAASQILDRGYGKPSQAVEVDANIQATISEIRRKIVRA